jgi:hypothetical protein
MLEPVDDEAVQEPQPRAHRPAHGGRSTFRRDRFEDQPSGRAAHLLRVTWFVLEGAEGLAWLALVFGAPLLLAAPAVGLVVARVARRRGDRARWPALVVCGAVALAVPAWTAIEHLRHGPHLPPERQAQLPVDTPLVNLCEASGISRRERRALRASVDVLLEELRERPRHLVTYTYYWADDSPEERDITVRELAEEQLKGLELASESDLAVHGRRCAPGITRRLREGL